MGCGGSKQHHSQNDGGVTHEKQPIIMHNSGWAEHQTDAKLTVVSIEDEAYLRENIVMLLNSKDLAPFVDCVHTFPDGLFKDVDTDQETSVEDWMQNKLLGGWHLGATAHDKPTKRVVVLLDIVLIRCDGVEICRSLRQRFGDEVCIIAATCNASTMAGTVYNTNGFDGIISKDFTKANMLPLLRLLMYEPHGWKEFM